MKKFAVIVSSDKCFAGEREDKSGKAIVEVLSSLGYELDEFVLLPDEYEMLKSAMEKLVDKKIPLVMTTGGTGFSHRDVMPEVTKAVIERETPGIPEAMRLKSLEITDRAMLSRAVAGIKDDTLIINLPGSEKAVRECLDVIMNAVKHGLEILLGETQG